MRILEILWNMDQLISEKSTYNSMELIKTIAELKQYNSLLITLDEKLYNEVQNYIATLDAEYAYSIDSSSSINSVEVARVMNELKQFIEKSADKIPLDLTIFNKTCSYTIEDSAKYFDNEDLPDNVIIQEGKNSFGLKGFELRKYLYFIKTRCSKNAVKC